MVGTPSPVATSPKKHRAIKRDEEGEREENKGLVARSVLLSIRSSLTGKKDESG